MINVDEDEQNDEIEINNNYDYKGYFIENEEADEDPKFFEFGAHFSYKQLYNILESIRNKQVKLQKGKQIEKILQPNKKRVIRERNNTRNKQNDKVNSLVKIINIFKSKGRSRNIIKEEQDEKTFMHNNKNILSLKKDKQNKSVTKYNTNNSGINYLKIYKNKIHNINLNNEKIGKLSDKYYQTKQKQKNFISKRLNLFSKSKSKNKGKNNINSKDSYEISLQRSFQTQIQPIKKSAKKNIKKNYYPIFSNSKKSIEKINKSYKKERIKLSQITTNKTAMKKIKFPNKAEISKKSIDLNVPNSSSKTNNKECIQKHKNSKLNNEKINTNNNKPMISVSIETNNVKVLKNNKIRSLKHVYKELNNNLLTSEFNKNKTKKNLAINKTKESLNILFNTNEKNSRNKLNDFLKNISLINFTDNKISLNTLSKINNTQQNINYSKKKLGIKKEKKSLINNNTNKNNISIPSYSNSNKKKPNITKLYNNCMYNNYYSTGFMSKNNPNKKINKTYLNCVILNNSHKLIKLNGIKSYKNTKNGLNNKNTLKNIIFKSNANKNEINKSKKNLKRSITNSELSQANISKNLAKSPFQKIGFKNLMNNNDNSKNNINININISNNNSNIIYNNNFNNINNREKSRSRLNTQKNTNSFNLKKNPNLKDNKKSSNIENKNKEINAQNKIYNKNNMNDKVKLIKIQFPKAKFINICDNDMKKV